MLIIFITSLKLANSLTKEDGLLTLSCICFFAVNGSLVFEDPTHVPITQPPRQRLLIVNT